MLIHPIGLGTTQAWSPVSIIGSGREAVGKGARCMGQTRLEWVMRQPMISLARLVEHDDAISLVLEGFGELIRIFELF